MKRSRFVWGAVALALAWSIGQTAPVLAQQTTGKAAPKASTQQQKKKAGRAKAGRNTVGQRAVKQVETVWGKPLTAAQKKSVVAAIQERDKAMKPIRDRYRARVARTLGVTPEQWAAKERTQRAAQTKKRNTAARR